MKRKSPALALAISLTSNIAFFPLLVVSILPGNPNYTVLSWAFFGLAICCLVTDGYGHFYTGE